MRHVLIVAYYFPPIGGIGSIRAASFANYLPEFGWEATVLAPAGTPHALDPFLDADRVSVVRSRSLELSQLGARPRVSGAAGNGESHRPVTRSALSRRLRRAVRQVTFPDPQIGWYPAAAKDGKRLLRQGTFDLIFSSALPITSHLIAWTLTRRSGLPWVAEFRDPWSDDPDFRVISSAALRLERAMAAKADAVVLPSETFTQYYAARWGIEGTAIGHGSDLAFPGSAPRPNPPVLAHVGTYYPGRQSLETLWAALAEMRRRGEPVPRLQCTGVFPDEGRAELRRHGLEDILDVTGFVSQPEALSVMSSSSALVACDFEDSGPLSLGTVPAKLFEYLASGVPIIHVGHPEGEAARMLSSHQGCYVVPFGDIEGAIRAVRAAVADEVRNRDVSELGRRARTEELAELFDSLLDRQHAGSSCKSVLRPSPTTHGA